MEFEWHESKNQQNIAKHDISFQKAKHVFSDGKRVVILDKKHSAS
jgi:uncharacterized protein